MTRKNLFIYDDLETLGHERVIELLIARTLFSLNLQQITYQVKILNDFIIAIQQLCTLSLS